MPLNESRWNSWADWLTNLWLIHWLTDVESNQHTFLTLFIFLDEVGINNVLCFRPRLVLIDDRNANINEVQSHQNTWWFIVDTDKCLWSDSRNFSAKNGMKDESSPTKHAIQSSTESVFSAHHLFTWSLSLSHSFRISINSPKWK